MNAKAALFGGALMAAGMTAQTQAQNFIYLDSGVGGAYPSYAVSNAFLASGYIAYAPVPLNTTSSGYNPLTGTTTMATTWDANGFGTTANWDGTGANGFGYGYTLIQQFFMVDAPGQLLIEWDYTGTDGHAASIVLETDNVPGRGLAGHAPETTLFSNAGQDGDPFAGSVLINVEPGVEYAYLGGFTDIPYGSFLSITSTDTQFINVSLVPTPGAAGVVGLACLACVRRRR